MGIGERNPTCLVLLALSVFLMVLELWPSPSISSVASFAGSLKRMQPLLNALSLSVKNLLACVSCTLLIIDNIDTAITILFMLIVFAEGIESSCPDH